MAGHPTIGTAHVILANQLLSPLNETHLVFDEGVGPIKVDFEIREGAPAHLFMHQPLPHFSDPLDKATIARVLSLDERDLEDELPVQIVSCGVPFILVPLRSLDAVQRAKVRLDLLELELGHLESNEILVFTPRNRES